MERKILFAESKRRAGKTGYFRKDRRDWIHRKEDP